MELLSSDTSRNIQEILEQILLFGANADMQEFNLSALHLI